VVRVARLLLAAAPLVLAGCAVGAGDNELSPSPGASPSASASVSPGGRPAGWVVRSDPAQGFSVAIPDAWDFVVRDSPTYTADLDAVSQHSTDLATYFKQSLAADAQVRLMAADSRSLATGFAANLQVMVSDLGPSGTAPGLSDLADAKVKLLSRQSGPVKRTSDRLSGEPAVRLDYSLGRPPPSPAPSGGATAGAGSNPGPTPSASPSPGTVPAIRSYLAVVRVGGRALEYELTMGALPGAAGTTFQVLGQNFKVFPPVAPSPSPIVAPSPPSAT
jgi:hypothetical protein